MIDPSRQRASALLGVPVEADDASVRAAFLKRLVASDFVPSEESSAAAERLTAVRLPLTQAADEVWAEFEKVDLEDFIGRYWSLSHEERSDRWRELDGRCRDAEVRETLDHLEDGLNVAVVEYADQSVDDAARAVRELFLLPPRESGIRRLELWATRAEHRDFYELEKPLRLVDPATKGLVPRLLSDVFESGLSLRRIPEMTQLQRDRIEADAVRQAQEAERRDEEPETRKASGGWGWGHWSGILVGIGIAIRIVIALNGSSKSTPAQPTSYYQQPKFTIPTFQSQQPYTPGQQKNKAFTATQIMQFIQYDPKSGQPEPAGYKQWLATQVVPPPTRPR